MLQIENNGPEIVATNYFATPHAHEGYFFLSLNAGAFRLLVPAFQIETLLAEVQLAKQIIIEKASDRVIIVLDDQSDVPYCLQLGFTSMDRIPADSDLNKPFLFSIWGPGPRKVFEAKAKLTKANE